MKKVYLFVFGIVSLIITSQLSANLNLLENSLPATLTSFSIESSGEHVILTWTTIDEINCDYYLIQRSRDQGFWFDVSTVDAAGNSNNPVDYDFTDNEPLPGSSFYRLVQVDSNGESEVLAVDKIDIVVIADIEIYPNPSDTEVFLEIDGGTNGVEVIVKDLAGNEILFEAQRFNPEKIRLNTSDLQNGIYIIKVKLGYQVITKKIIVNHNR